MPPTRKICPRLGPNLDQFGTTWPNLATLGRTGLQLCPLLFHPASLLCHPVPLLCCPVAKLGQVGGKLGPTWFQVGPTWGLLGANGTQVGGRMGPSRTQACCSDDEVATSKKGSKVAYVSHFWAFEPGSAGPSWSEFGLERARQSKNYQDVTKF